MMILDRALEQRERAGQPIRVGLVGTGYMARAITSQFYSPLPGMRVVGIAGRNLTAAQKCYADAGIANPVTATTPAELDRALANEQPVVMADPLMLCEAPDVDVIIEATGHVETSAKTVLHAIHFGKHVVMMNAELDATVGPILKVYADRAGVCLTNTEGDEPGVACNLYRFVKSIGYQPVMAGNIKGFLDRKRNPDTQRAFAEKTGQNARMVTSFADGTKLSMELTLVANATGLRVAQRGMIGPKCEHVKDVLKHFDPDALRAQPLVDFALGSTEPGSGAFVLGYSDNPVKAQYASYFKMGDGPLYCFYTPFHLPHLEVAVTVGRAALFNDAAVSPLGGPVCDVVTMAKCNLSAGETLDGIGGFHTYGMIDNADTADDGHLLPMGLSEGCRLVRDVAADQPLTYDDVELPPGRLCDQLREEQNAHFANLAAAQTK